MSDEQHEPSYYEIALTGRQVTGAFVVVLVCLLVAFFAGVWIGRGAPRGEALAESGGGAPAEVPPPKDELSFFADRPADRPAEPKPAAPAASPPPVEAAPAPVVSPPPVVTPSEPAVDEPPPPPPAPKPEPKPAAGEAPKPEAPKPTATPPASPAPSGPLVIQVFTSSDEAKAKDMLKKVKAKGFKAYLSPTKTNGKTVYRVRVGPFQKEADAKVTSDKIEKQFKVDTWITRSP